MEGSALDASRAAASIVRSSQGGLTGPGLAISSLGLSACPTSTKHAPLKDGLFGL